MYVCMSLCLSVCLSVCLSACLSVCLYVCLSVNSLSACLSVCPSVCLFICCVLCTAAFLGRSGRNLSDGHRGSDMEPYSTGPPGVGVTISKMPTHLRWMYAAIVNTYQVIRVCLYHVEVFMDRKRLHIA